MAFHRETSFLFIISCSVAVVLILVGLFNLIIDPYGLFRVFEIDGVNTQKPSVSVNSSWAKAHTINKIKPKAIVLGTSRVEVGINPDSSYWPGESKPRYNLGLASGNMVYAEKYFQHANAIQPLEEVILGLDFLMFRADYVRRKDMDDANLLKHDKDNSLFASLSNNIYGLFSLDALKASFNTINIQSENPKFKYTFNGMRSISHFETKFTSSGHRELFISNERRFISARFYNIRRHKQFLYNKSGNSSQELMAFRSLVKSCLSNNIKLYMFISPVHARQLELIRHEDQWNAFEQWKRELVRIIDEESKENFSTPPLELWDFSGYNAITTETVPTSNETNKPMNWYWESSHYKQQLGDIILGKLFNLSNDSSNKHLDFGRVLNTNNIEQHLDQLRSKRNQYTQSNIKDIHEVKSLIDERELRARFPSRIPRNITQDK